MELHVEITIIRFYFVVKIFSYKENRLMKKKVICYQL